MNTVEDIPLLVKDMLIGLGAKEEAVVPGAILKTDLQIDSLDMLEISLELSVITDADMMDGEVEGFKTVGDIHAYLERFLPKKNLPHGSPQIQ